MSWRYRKSIEIAPGVRINISKSGISSTTLGGKYVSVNVGGNGTYLNTSIPGTGVYNRVKLTGFQKTDKSDQTEEKNINDNSRRKKTKSVVLGLVSPSSYIAKEAAKYAYEDDPEGYNRNKGKYAFRGFLAPAAASYQLERARKLKKKGYTPEEIRKDIEGLKTTAVALGADFAAAPIGQGAMRYGGSYIHGGIHKLRKKIQKKDKSSIDKQSKGKTKRKYKISRKSKSRKNNSQ